MQQFSLGEPPEHSEEGRPWYDNKYSIKAHLNSLARFLLLVRTRHIAGYKREERMNEFCVMGRFWLDTCGNCSRIQDINPKEKVPDILDVLTREEFWELIKERVGKDTHVTFVHGDGLPSSPNITCPVCGKGWTIQNCHDTVVCSDSDVFPLTEFVGRTLGDVKHHYAQLTNAVYGICLERPLRNDLFIDNSPKYPNPKSDWEKGAKKNERGWVSATEGITDDFMIGEGDEGFFNIWTFYHGVCNRKHLTETEEQQFRKIFEDAGFEDIRMNQTPNQYCRCHRCAPWFNVNSTLGTILIGWRKRVINIEWNGLFEGKAPDLSHLFKEEDVTKWETGIHAWGWEAAQEYLSRVRSHLTA